MITDRATPADEAVLKECLEPVIAGAVGGRSAITAMHWQRFDLATSYDTHVVTVRLDDGDERRVFVKDFGFTVRPKDEPKRRREREVGVYRELLAGASLGTARYYGAVMDESRGQFWLLLEFVDGTPVGYCDIAESWAPAAAALGHLHGRFAEHAGRLAGCDFLRQHTADFFWSKVEAASECVARIAPELGDQLTRMTDRYGEVVDVLTDQPRTLVHGACRSTNILVKVASDPSRVCILDWEEAACGAPLYDVAYLLDGIEPPTLDPLLEAYRQAALSYGLPLPGGHEMRHVLHCFRLHMVTSMLSHAVVKRYTHDGVAKLLAIGNQVRETLYT